MNLKQLISAIYLICFIAHSNGYCPKNEVYRTENVCESSCRYREFKHDLTTPRCVCRDGYARDPFNRCIDAKYCVYCCDKIEVLDQNSLNQTCVQHCVCAEGYYRVEGTCTKCDYPALHKSRCEILDIQSCACTKCRPQYKTCNGKCYKNHSNCKKYSEKDCKCEECNPGYRCCEGGCFKEVQSCAHYNSACECAECYRGFALCNRECVKSECGGGKTFNYQSCSCECPNNTIFCQSNCVSPNCTALEYFSYKSCKCLCKDGYYYCNNACHPVIPKCETYDDKTCECTHCKKGYTFCNGNCISTKCGKHEFFANSICQCVCKDGYLKNKKGICCKNKKKPSKFYQALINSAGSSKYCQKNEFYRKCPPEFEETCEGNRLPKSDEKCFCKKGFRRDLKTNVCLKICPLPGNPHQTHERFECGHERYCWLQQQSQSRAKFTVNINQEEKQIQLPKKSTDLFAQYPWIFPNNCGYHCIDGYGRNGLYCEKCGTRTDRV